MFFSCPYFISINQNYMLSRNVTLTCENTRLFTRIPFQAKYIVCMSKQMVSRLLRKINRSQVFNTQSTVHKLRDFLRCIFKENHFLFSTFLCNKTKENRYIIKLKLFLKSFLNKTTHVLFWLFIFCFVDLFQVFSHFI